MDIIKTRLDELLRALKTVEIAIVLFHQKQPTGEYLATFQDSLIKRFGYTSWTFWKFLKLWIRKTYNSHPNINSPHKILAELIRLNIMNDAEINLLSECIYLMDLVPESLNEEPRQIILNRVEAQYQMMLCTAKKIEQNNQSIFRSQNSLQPIQAL